MTDDRSGARPEPRPANQRGAARLAAVQALYQLEIGGGDLLEVVQEFEAFRLGIQDLSNSPDTWISCRLVSQVAVPLAQGEKDFRVRY